MLHYILLVVTLSMSVLADFELYTLQYGTAGIDQFYGTCIDSNDNVYGVGISNTIDFRLVKMTSSGQFVKDYVSQSAYSKKTQVDECDCTVDSTDTINVVVRFDGDSLGGIENPGRKKVAYLIQFNTELEVLKSQYVSESDIKNGHSIAVDDQDFIYIAGSIYSKAQDTDYCYLGKFSSQGQPVTTKIFGVFKQALLHHCTNLAIDSRRDIVYVTGYSDYTDTRKMGIIRFKASNFEQRMGTFPILSPVGMSDNVVGLSIDGRGNVYTSGVRGESGSSTNAFITKYDGKKGTMTELWVREFGVTTASIIRDLVVEGDSVYGVGFTTQAIFEGYEIPNQIPSRRTICYVRLAGKTGSTLFATGYASDQGQDYASGVVIDSNGHSIAVGWARGSIEPHTSAGLEDYFVFSYRKD